MKLPKTPFHAKFIGRYRDLVPMGFTFQLLYNNRVSYHKGNIFIFKSGDYMTCSTIEPSDEDKAIIKELKFNSMIGRLKHE